MYNLALVLTFALSPPSPHASPPSAVEVAAPALQVEGGEYVEPSNGLRVRWASAKYEVDDHQIEVFVQADTSNRADAYVHVDGELIVESTYNQDGRGGVTTWVAPDHDLSEDMLAAINETQAAVADKLANALGGMGPQETKCSQFGKGVLKAVKYAWYGLCGGLTAACCTTVTPGCILCAGAAQAAAGIGGDIFDSHCD